MNCRRLHIVLFSLVLLFAGNVALGQAKYKPKNLGKFDSKKYHFGFLLGFNAADYYIQRKTDLPSQDSLLSVNGLNQSGFNLGIIASWNMTKNISLRFQPTLSFEDRVLQYVFYAGQDSTSLFDKRVESTFIDFPINLKFRTDRINNFAAYAITGVRFRVDMQSERDVKNAVADDILVKAERNDFMVEFGGGFDFFLTYFKFGIDLRMGVGIPNILVPENTQFSNPIESLRSRSFMVTLTFEG